MCCVRIKKKKKLGYNLGSKILCHLIFLSQVSHLKNILTTGLQGQTLFGFMRECM